MNDYNRFKRGSEWLKWDLHFHTPSSHDYKDKSITDEQIVTTLLENEISVVAITDHYIIDSERIKNLQKIADGKLTILPGIEFCSELGGSESIHFIGIFPEESDIVSLWTTLQGKLGLTTKDISDKGGFQNLQCDLVDTCSLIHSLGGLTTIHAGSKTNTVENIKNNAINKMQQKKQILSDSIDILEIGKVDDIIGYKEKVFKGIGFDVPLIICSDNHKITEYEIKENLWIKSNPTFEGLRQIIFEPNERVKIQGNKPEEKSGYHVIDYVKLNKNLFWDTEVHFNNNLNTIIGGRSTGKSTLLKSIANKVNNKSYLSNEFIDENIDSVELFWKDGENEIARDIQFFPQSHMYEIAESSDRTNSLIKEIIIEKDNNYLYAKYDDICNKIKTEIVNDVNTLFQLQSDINIRKKNIIEQGDKEGILKEIALLEDNIKSISSDNSITKDEVETFELLVKKINDQKTKYDSLKNDIVYIDTLKNKNIFSSNIEYEFSALTEQSRNFINESFIKIKEEATEQWNKKLKTLSATITDSQEKISKDISSNQNSIVYNKGLSYANNNKQYQELQSRLGIERNKIKSILDIEKTIILIEKQKKELISNIHTKHLLYQTKTSDLVKSSHISHEGIEIKPTIVFRSDDMNDFFNIRFNLRGNDRQKYISDFVTNYPNDVLVQIKEILNKSINNNIEYKSGHVNSNVISELLSTNWFSISYDLIYQNDSFKVMSQGKQAFVILKLLLDFSEKKCPILIDQPEDSLDNRAIYNELVQYLKKKKKQRQIILVTHNPNVVVSADSEQIIVANQNGRDSKNTDDKKFDYISGGLEHSMIPNKSEMVLTSQGIREHVCEVLEGGNEAFKMRELKYGINSI